MTNAPMNKAKAAKCDEFYTQLDTVGDEMHAYADYNPELFKGKTVLLPCDDPEWSAFTSFFTQKFDELGLHKLISTSYSKTGKGKLFTLKRDRRRKQTRIADLEWEWLEGNGDFRSAEVTALRDQADFVITNPPFSLFREFLAWCLEGGQAFSIIGNIDAITNKDMFPLFQREEIWLGATGNDKDMPFGVPADQYVDPADARKAAKMGFDADYAKRVGFNGKYTRLGKTAWFTNIEYQRRHIPSEFSTEAENRRWNSKVLNNSEAYCTYDNYDAIEVPYCRAIPSDFKGVMGVPKSFLNTFCPDQFEIVGITENGEHSPVAHLRKPAGPRHDRPYIAGRRLQPRILIRHR